MRTVLFVIAALGVYVAFHLACLAAYRVGYRDGKEGR